MDASIAQLEALSHALRNVSSRSRTAASHLPGVFRGHFDRPTDRADARGRRSDCLMYTSPTLPEAVQVLGGP